MQLLHRMVIKEQVLNRINVNKDLEDLATLDISGTGEVQLSIETRVTESVREGEEHFLRDAIEVVTEGPTNEVPEISSVT
jgi:hypothetical protein